MPEPQSSFGLDAYTVQMISDVRNNGMNYPLPKVLEIMKPSKASKSANAQLRLKQAMQSEDYIGEEKIDGCHYTTIENRIFSPRISDVTGLPVEKTAQLAHISTALDRAGFNQAIFDGEINYPGMKAQDVITITGCAPDKALERQERGNNWLYYTIYDVLRDPKGDWLLNQSFYYRRKLLVDLKERLEKSCPFIKVNPTFRSSKQKKLDEILERGGEGIVLKSLRGLYVPGKRPAWNWIKIKTETEADVVIMGFEAPEKYYTGKDFMNWPYWVHRGSDIVLEGSYAMVDGDYEPVTKYFAMGWIGAITIGLYLNGKLTKIGTCSGMDESMRAAFTHHPEDYIGKVAHIKAMEITRDGVLRHPSFKGIHPDKNPYECTSL